MEEVEPDEPDEPEEPLRPPDEDEPDDPDEPDEPELPEELPEEEEPLLLLPEEPPFPPPPPPPLRLKRSCDVLEKSSNEGIAKAWMVVKSARRAKMSCGKRILMTVLLCGVLEEVVGLRRR